MADPMQLLTNLDDPRLRVDPWKVRCWRELRGLTQKQLGDAAGYGTRGDETICRVEGYALTVGAVRCAKLAKALRVHAAELQSKAVDFKTNQELFEEWNDAGRPDLRGWLKSRG